MQEFHECCQKWTYAEKVDNLSKEDVNNSERQKLQEKFKKYLVNKHYKPNGRYTEHDLQLNFVNTKMRLRKKFLPESGCKKCL